VQLIANLSLFIDFCVNLLNRDTNQLHIVCPFEGHPVKPQTFIKSTLIFRVDPCSWICDWGSSNLDAIQLHLEIM